MGVKLLSSLESETMKITGGIILDNVTDIVYHSAKITLSQAQIQSISTTPVELIPAPGVNKVINVISGTLWKGINGTSYTVNVNQLDLRYINGDDAIGSFPLSISGTAEHGRSFKKSTSDSDTRDNDGIDIWTSAGNPTGNGATITIHLNYTITTHP